MREKEMTCTQKKKKKEKKKKKTHIKQKKPLREVYTPAIRLAKLGAVSGRTGPYCS